MLRRRLFALAALGLLTFSAATEASWKPYIDTLIKKGNNSFKYAGLYGQDGATWAASAGITTNAAEIKDLVAGLRDVSKLQAAGIKFNGAKYMFLHVADGVVVGRKGPNSICLKLSGKALVVGVTNDGVQPVNAVNAINFVVADLVKKKF